MRYYITNSPASPLGRFIAGIIAVISLAAAFFFGMVILAIVAVAIAIFSLAFWLRAWWMRRKGAPDTAAPRPRPPSGEIIEGEYTVVSERHD